MINILCNHLDKTVYPGIKEVLNKQMNSLRLTDLDELVLTVRDKSSRSYILEAVNAYRGGAYRAAIVGTWIAVSYDIIAKIRELASQGDPQASKFVENLNKAIETKNIPNLQKIEENLLEDAHKEDDGYGLLSLHEYTDLKRLKDDRNLCAHPAFVAEEALFQPTPELVRTHIVHAIAHLLQHQPVQGKSAIKHVLSDIKGTIFPQELETVCNFLNDKYLNKAKPALIKNLIDVLVKILLKSDEPDFLGKESAIIHSLMAISRKHSNIYEQRMSDKLSNIVAGLDDNQLAYVFRLISADIIYWNWLQEAQKIRIKEYLKCINSELSKIDNKDYSKSQNTSYTEKIKLLLELNIFKTIEILELQEILLKIFEQIDYYSQLTIIGAAPDRVFVEQSINFYSNAGSYGNATFIGQTALLPMADLFSPEEIIRILTVVKDENQNNSNNQIYPAKGMPEVIEIFFDKTIRHLDYTKKSWKELMDFIVSKYGVSEKDYAYPSLRKKLQKYGIWYADKYSSF
ncbi:hypothetical protein H1Q63_07355 [Desmonostoc muscorum CCALA 125]|nr:hypothetical protein [Desmonostoc muscorum CCALA 125]